MISCYLLDLCGGRHLACVLGCVQGHMSFDTISSILPNKINLNNRDGIGPLPQSTELPRGELRWQRATGASFSSASEIAFVFSLFFLRISISCCSPYQRARITSLPPNLLANLAPLVTAPCELSIPNIYCYIYSQEPSLSPPTPATPGGFLYISTSITTPSPLLRFPFIPL